MSKGVKNMARIILQCFCTLLPALSLALVFLPFWNYFHCNSITRQVTRAEMLSAAGFFVLRRLKNTSSWVSACKKLASEPNSFQHHILVLCISNEFCNHRVDCSKFDLLGSIMKASILQWLPLQGALKMAGILYSTQYQRTANYIGEILASYLRNCV